MGEETTCRPMFQVIAKLLGRIFDFRPGYRHADLLESATGESQQEHQTPLEQDGIEDRGPVRNALQTLHPGALGIHAVIAKVIPQFGDLEILHHLPRLG